MDFQTVQVISRCVTGIKKHTNKLLHSADKNNLCDVMHHKEMIKIYSIALDRKLAEVAESVQYAQLVDPGNPKEYNG